MADAATRPRCGCVCLAARSAERRPSGGSPRAVLRAVRNRPRRGAVTFEPPRGSDRVPAAGRSPAFRPGRIPHAQRGAGPTADASGGPAAPPAVGCVVARPRAWGLTSLGTRGSRSRVATADLAAIEPRGVTLAPRGPGCRWSRRLLGGARVSSNPAGPKGHRSGACATAGPHDGRPRRLLGTDPPRAVGPRRPGGPGFQPTRRRSPQRPAGRSTWRAYACSGGDRTRGTSRCLRARGPKPRATTSRTSLSTVAGRGQSLGSRVLTR